MQPIGSSISGEVDAAAFSGGFSTSWKRRILRGAFSAVVFLASLAGAAAVISVAAGRSPVPEFSGKLAHLAERGGDYDVLFLGSSRVRRQFSPQVFDAALEQSGLAMKSYNFGLDGMGFPEILYVADQILALKPARLKYVFIELTRFGREFGPLLQSDSPRTIYWHTLKYTALQAQAIWVNPTPPPVMERLSLIGEHFEIFLRRAGNVGRGPEIMKAFGKRARISTKVGPSGDGFFPVNEQFPSNRRADYAQQLSKLSTVLREKPAAEPLFVEATLELVRKFQAAGITPIVVTMPRIHPTSPWVPDGNPSKDGPGVMTLRFHDPAVRAELFDPRLHYDPQHLNADGAKVFSRMLAEEFAGFVKKKRGPSDE